MFRGQGSFSSVSNYRSISLLPLPSKLLEHIVHNRLMKYLLCNDLLSPCQFGFCPCSSTQETLLYATNDWHYHLDSGHSVALVFFNLSKAFDRVPHSQLTSKLSKHWSLWFTYEMISLLPLQPIPEGCPQWPLLHHPSSNLRCPPGLCPWPAALFHLHKPADHHPSITRLFPHLVRQ